MAFAKPLRWPIGWKRTEWPTPPQFKAPYATVINDLQGVLDYLECENPVITTNQDTRLDGGLRTAREATPDDTGVALYFTRHSKELCIPCDRFSSVYGNIRAIGLTLEYIKRMERYGTSQMVEAAFSGFKALPETIILSEHTARAWYEVLQVSQSASWDVIDAAYKRLLHSAHPDKGGSDYLFQELQEAYKQAKEAQE